jgi:D-alanyl-D-alanine carboxypeptidase
MKIRFYFLFCFFTFLFLFYPGESDLFKIFAYNRSLFEKNNIVNKPVFVPKLINKYYPDITAEGVYVVDKKSFTPIFERNPHLKFYPASTTKIITSLVSYDVYKLNQIVQIKKIPEEGQMMGLVLGEKITVEYLIYGTLIQSGNDAAFSLAYNFGLKKFVNLMNEKVRKLKMKDTKFVDPVGYDSPNQYTSPFDLALVARELLNNQYLSKIVSIKDITISDVDYKYFHNLSNINKLIGEISGIGGVKTGYTENAKENLISFYKESDDKEFIIVVLKSEDRFNDTLKVVDWIKSNIEFIKVE